MEFIRISDLNTGERALAARLANELSERRVLWLVPGGSNIPISVIVMNSLPKKLQANLTVALTDERYGAPNHLDSNWLQLREAGFRPGVAKIIPVLGNRPMPLGETITAYEKNLKQALDEVDLVIGQFGIGPDGHIAGILPNSSAAIDKNLVCGYQAPTFTRITLTPAGFKYVDAAYVFAFGDEKLQTLQNLLDKNLPIAKQPSQILKTIEEVYVYNDQIGTEG